MFKGRLEKFTEEKALRIIKCRNVTSDMGSHRTVNCMEDIFWKKYHFLYLYSQLSDFGCCQKQAAGRDGSLLTLGAGMLKLQPLPF